MSSCSGSWTTGGWTCATRSCTTRTQTCTCGRSRRAGCRRRRRTLRSWSGRRSTRATSCLASRPTRGCDALQPPARPPARPQRPVPARVCAARRAPCEQLARRACATPSPRSAPRQTRTSGCCPCRTALQRGAAAQTLGGKAAGVLERRPGMPGSAPQIRPAADGRRRARMRQHPPRRRARAAQVERVYLIEVTDTEWYTLNLESVFLLDRTTRKLSRCEVQRADDATDTTDNVLRITCAALRGRAGDSLARGHRLARRGAVRGSSSSQCECASTHNTSSSLLDTGP